MSLFVFIFCKYHELLILDDVFGHQNDEKLLLQPETAFSMQRFAWTAVSGGVADPYLRKAHYDSIS